MGSPQVERCGAAGSRDALRRRHARRLTYTPMRLAAIHSSAAAFRESAACSLTRPPGKGFGWVRNLPDGGVEISGRAMPTRSNVSSGTSESAAGARVGKRRSPTPARPVHTDFTFGEPRGGHEDHGSTQSEIRHVPDFPKAGILFYDITTLLQIPSAARNRRWSSTPFIGRVISSWT